MSTNDTVRYQQGVVVKDPRYMTDQELMAWRGQCAGNARAYLFSVNQPLTYIREDGHAIAEYKNGTVRVVR